MAGITEVWLRRIAPEVATQNEGRIPNKLQELLKRGNLRKVPAIRARLQEPALSEGMRVTATGKKLHHFVPRFYLRAWEKEGKLFCLQNGSIRRDTVRNLGAENYFYRLRQLRAEDVDFLRAFIDRSPEGLKASHRRLLNAFRAPLLAKRNLVALGLATREGLAELERRIVELNEELHTGIEDDFQPQLAAMIAGDLSFLEDDGRAAVFYGALSVQYARTNHIRKTRLVMDRERFALYERITNLLVHFLAANVGSSLYADRKRHKIVLLDNKTDVPFITGDQPVINIASGPKEEDPPQKFELFYPLSPKRAMLLLEPPGPFPATTSPVSEMFASMCNLRIAAASYRQVFSDSLGALESVIEQMRAYLSCFPEPDAKVDSR